MAPDSKAPSLPSWLTIWTPVIDPICSGYSDDYLTLADCNNPARGQTVPDFEFYGIVGGVSKTVCTGRQVLCAIVELQTHVTANNHFTPELSPLYIAVVCVVAMV